MLIQCFYRKVSIEEASKVAENIGLCHFVETSAAESFEAVDSVFRQLFRLAKATCQSIEKATLEPEIKRSFSKTSRRRGSITQIKQKLYEYYRKNSTNPDLTSFFKPSSSENEMVNQAVKGTTNKENCLNITKTCYSFPTKCHSLGVLIEKNEKRHHLYFQDTHNKTEENCSSKCSSKESLINRKKYKHLASSTLDIIYFENTSDAASSTTSFLVDEISHKNIFSDSKQYQPDPEKPKSAPYQSVTNIQQFFPSHRKASLFTEKELENNNKLCILHKQNHFSCKNKINSSKQIFKVFKNAFGRDKAEKCEFDKLTCCLSNDDETQNNKSDKSVYGLTKIPLLQNNFTKKHQRRPSLREAVKILIGTRNKAVDSVI